MPFSGQAPYLEWRTDTVLHGFLIPEQGLTLPTTKESTAAVSHPLLGTPASVHHITHLS